MSKRIFVTCLFAISFYIIGNIPVYAYIDKETHPAITGEAVIKSELDNFLKGYLDISDGTDHRFTNEQLLSLFPEDEITNSVLDWLKFGSEYEDVGGRAKNHFHDPVRNTGLDNFPFSGESNKDWAMGAEGINGYRMDYCSAALTVTQIFRGEGCNAYSHTWAKAAYLAALTGETGKKRNENFAVLFESLGKILHLIEDMGVPAHTRNDFYRGHWEYTEIGDGVFLKLILPPIFLEPYEDWLPDILPIKILGWGNFYEYWVELEIIKENKLGNNYVGSLCTPDKMLIPEFPTPEEYWDRGKYDGAGFNPDGTLPLNGEERVGLSEYTSANYLSKCAMFTEDYDHDNKKYFPFPREECLDSIPKKKIQVTAEDGQYDLVWYQHKVRDGEIFDEDPFVKVSYTWDAVDAKGNEHYPTVGKLCYILDDNVHKAYAKRLLPKTVSYAAGFLNYFFRGKFRMVPDEDTNYGFVIENNSPDDADGTF